MPNSQPPASSDGGRRPAEGRRPILLNGVTALLLGSGITVLLHELAHWVTGALLGSPSLLFGFGVTHQPALTGRDAAIAALAGPVVSLLIGAAMQVLQPFRFRGDFAHLLWIWIACTSMMLATTYLVITPFAGDTAVGVAELGLPGWVAWVAAAVGVLGMFGVARQWATHAVRMCGHDLARLRSFSWYPWLLALPINLALSLGYLATAHLPTSPAEKIVIVLAPVAQTVFAPMSLPFSRRVDELEEPLTVDAYPVAGLLALAGLIALNFALSAGVRLG